MDFFCEIKLYVSTFVLSKPLGLVDKEKPLGIEETNNIKLRTFKNS